VSQPNERADKLGPLPRPQDPLDVRHREPPRAGTEPGPAGRQTGRRSTPRSPAKCGCPRPFSAAQLEGAEGDRAPVRLRAADGRLRQPRFGMPEAVAWEENLLDQVTLTAESGVIGGLPQRGLDFGAAMNPSAIIPPERSVRLLRRWRARQGLPRHGRGRRKRQRQRQPVRQSLRRSRWLHQHHAGRAAARVRRAGSPPARSRWLSARGVQVFRAAAGAPASKFVDSVEQITFNGRWPQRQVSRSSSSPSGASSDFSRMASSRSRSRPRSTLSERSRPDGVRAPDP
jgi:hypothetical protein